MTFFWIDGPVFHCFFSQINSICSKNARFIVRWSAFSSFPNLFLLSQPFPPFSTLPCRFPVKKCHGPTYSVISHFPVLWGIRGKSMRLKYQKYKMAPTQRNHVSRLYGVPNDSGSRAQGDGPALQHARQQDTRGGRVAVGRHQAGRSSYSQLQCKLPVQQALVCKAAGKRPLGTGYSLQAGGSADRTDRRGREIQIRPMP